MNSIKAMTISEYVEAILAKPRLCETAEFLAAATSLTICRVNGVPCLVKDVEIPKVLVVRLVDDGRGACWEFKGEGSFICLIRN